MSLGGTRAAKERSGGRGRNAATADPPPRIEILAVRRGDLDPIVALDATVTGLEKRAYWRSVYQRYGAAPEAGRQFLVADAGGRVVGFVIGEVRDWEFGSPPCGWVFAITMSSPRRGRPASARGCCWRSAPGSGRGRAHGAHDARAR